MGKVSFCWLPFDSLRSIEEQSDEEIYFGTESERENVTAGKRFLAFRFNENCLCNKINFWGV